MHKDEKIAKAASYHEAGHAVMAYQYGWWVNHEGVEVERRQYTGLRCHGFAKSPTQEIPISLAGWLSEHRFHGLGGRFRKDEDLQNILDALEWPDDDEDESDDAAVFRLIKDMYPDDSDGDLIARYREWEQEVWGWLGDAELWTKVERVAESLWQHKKLTAKQVEQLIDGV